MGTTPSPILGVPIPDSASDPRAFGAQMAALVTALEKFSTPTVASYSALKTKFPNGSATTDVPLFTEVTNDTFGAYQYLPAPYLLWAPILGSKKRFQLGGRTDGVTPTVAAPGSVSAVTGTLSLPSYEWPHLIEIRFRTMLNAVTDSDRTNVYVSVNGTGDAYCQVQGDGSGVSTLSFINQGTASPQSPDPTTLVGAIQKYSGSDTVTATYADSHYTLLETVVSPIFDPSSA